MMIAQKSERLLSLDVFRGFTMAAMILVNNAGDWGHVYTQLGHSAWNGWTFTDWIFPFFLWIAGVSSTFSFVARRTHGDSNRKLITQVLRRSAMIFALGVFLYAFPFGLIGTEGFSFSTFRILGVLQRIAICYFIGSFVYLYVPLRHFWIVILGLFISYWAMMMLIPVPGVGAGAWEPGRNFAAYVDLTVLGTHNWSLTRTWDPEGIVSTIPSIATFLFGILAGNFLRTGTQSKEEKTGWLFVTGGMLLVVSVFLDMWIPINKSLWTPSYVLMMAGWAHVVFASCYFLIDVKNFRKWPTPFLFYGMNAIFVYALASMIETLAYVITVPGHSPGGVLESTTLHDLLMNTVFSPHLSAYNASLMYAVATDLVVFVVAWGMWKKKIFLKI